MRGSAAGSEVLATIRVVRFETLDTDGRLVVLTADGSRVAISAGDVYFGDAASAPAAG